MSLGPELRIAVRQITRRRGTIVALSVICGSAALFAFIVLVTSWQRVYLRGLLIDVTPHVTVSADRLEPLVPRRLFDVGGGVVELVVNAPPRDRREIKPRVEVATRARRSSDLITAAAPYVRLRGVFRNGPRYHTVDIHGVDPTHERSIDRRQRGARRGGLAALKSVPDGTIIGQALADRLGITTGRDVTLVSSSGVIRRLHVIGVFRSDVRDVDDARAYVNLALAQSLRGMARNAATGISLELSDPSRAARVANAVERATGYRTETWEQTRADVLAGYRARELAAWSVATLALVVAAFGLANALTASVLASNERSRRDNGEGVVRASVVMLEGAILGLAGGALGAGVGFAVASMVSRSGMTAVNFIDSYVRFDAPNVSPEPLAFLATVGLTTAVAIAASIAPARHAARLVASTEYADRDPRVAAATDRVIAP